MAKVMLQVAKGRTVKLDKVEDEVKVVEYHNCLEDGEFCGTVTWTAGAEEVYDLIAMHFTYLASLEAGAE
jgi:hypothetical protein